MVHQGKSGQRSKRYRNRRKPGQRRRSRSRDRNELSWWQSDTVDNWKKELVAYIRQNRNNTSAFGGTSYCLWLQRLSNGIGLFDNTMSSKNKNLKDAAKYVRDRAPTCMGDVRGGGGGGGGGGGSAEEAMGPRSTTRDLTASLTAEQIAEGIGARRVSTDAQRRQKISEEHALKLFKHKAARAARDMKQYKDAERTLESRNIQAQGEFETAEKDVERRIRSLKASVKRAYEEYKRIRNRNIEEVRELKNQYFRARDALRGYGEEYNKVLRHLGLRTKSEAELVRYALAG